MNCYDTGIFIFCIFLLFTVNQNKKKHKKKSKKKENVNNSKVKQAEKTPRPKGDIPFEDVSTAEYRAREFLKTWHKDKANWKFIKARQNWLIHHMYNPEKVRQ